MNIEDIKANQIVTMTADWHRLFNIAGCDPACHGCDKQLPVGESFKLSTIKNDKNGDTDVMLCQDCDPVLLAKELLKEQKLSEKYRRENPHHGCYRVNGVFV